jgi:choline dehydrogenase-like flavoprotein
MAYGLAQRGLSVVVVEQGERQDPSTFEHSEPAMAARLYKDAGLQATEDRDLTIAQGCTVGGSTVINNAIWMRCDLDRVLPEWREHGAPVERTEIEPAYKVLERNLGVERIPVSLANRSAEAFLQGARTLGISASYLQHNRRECIGCGWCNYGCRYNRKTSMLVTYIPWAEARGARVLDGCKGARIRSRGRRVEGVSFERRGSQEHVDADRVVVCAGAIGSSSVLLESGIHLGGRVGAGLHVLGGVFVSAEMGEDLDGFDGIGLCSIADSGGTGTVIESYFAPPLVFSLSLGGWFETHFERMSSYRRYAMAGVMVGTPPSGRVYLDRKGRTRISLGFGRAEIDRLKSGIRRTAEIYFAAGAKRVLPATFKDLELTGIADLRYLDDLIRAPDDLVLGSAHPQGGNPMNVDPEKGVIGADYRVHGFENLFVADASVFPSNILANCQATVMAVSHCAAGYVAGELRP